MYKQKTLIVSLNLYYYNKNYKLFFKSDWLITMLHLVKSGSASPAKLILCSNSTSRYEKMHIEITKKN